MVMLFRTANLILLVVLLSTITQIQAATFEKFIDKLTRTAKQVKSQLIKFYNRFRAFFTGHSQATHHLMILKGCGYAVDDEPMIYNKRSSISAKIKGGEDAIWHTW